MNPNPIIECYDIGGTNLRGAAISSGGIQIVIKRSTVRGDVDCLCEQIAGLSTELRRADMPPPAAVAIGVPGPVDPGGVMRGSRPLDLDCDVDFAALLQDRIKEPVIVANDVTMAVFAELHAGGGRGLENFCLVSISTGIGVGLVLSGSVVQRNSELGHSIVEFDSRRANPCQGHAGCWVAQAAGLGIQQTLRREGLGQDIEAFFDGAPPQEMMDAFRDYNARGLGNVINAYDPERVFLMGSLAARQFKRVIPSREEIGKYTIIRPVPGVELSSLGDDIGLLGAYYRAKEILG